MRILTNEQIRFIFRACHALNGEKCERRSLADMFNISESMVSNIAHGKSWKEEITKLVLEVKDEEIRKKIIFNIECERNYKREGEMKRKRGAEECNLKKEENDVGCNDEGASEKRMKTEMKKSMEMGRKRELEECNFKKEENDVDCDDGGGSKKRMKSGTENNREMRLKERCKKIEKKVEQKNMDFKKKRESKEEQKKEMVKIVEEMKEYYRRSKKEDILCWKGLDKIFEESQKKVTNEEIDFFFG